MRTNSITDRRKLEELISEAICDNYTICGVMRYVKDKGARTSYSRVWKIINRAGLLP